MSKFKAPSLITPEGILMFPAFFTPATPLDPSKPGKYQCMLAIRKDQQKSEAFKNLQMGIKEAIEAEFGAGTLMSSLKNKPIFKVSEIKKYDGMLDDDIILRVSSERKPGIVDRNRQDIMNPLDVWSGQTARLYVQPYAYDVPGNKGIKLTLNAVQIIRTDGERLDGQRPASAVFGDEYAEQKSAGKPKATKVPQDDTEDLFA